MNTSMASTGVAFGACQIELMASSSWPFPIGSLSAHLNSSCGTIIASRDPSVANMACNGSSALPLKSTSVRSVRRFNCHSDQRPALLRPAAACCSTRLEHGSSGDQKGWLKKSPSVPGFRDRARDNMHQAGPGREHHVARGANQNAESGEEAEQGIESSRGDSSGANDSSQHRDESLHRGFARGSEESLDSEDAEQTSGDCSLQEWIRYHNQMLDQLSETTLHSRVGERDDVESNLDPLRRVAGEGNAGEVETRAAEDSSVGSEEDKDGCPAIDDDEMMEALRVRLREFVESKDDIADHITDESTEGLLTMGDMEHMFSKEEARKLIDECFHYVMDAFSRMETNLAGLELLATRRALHRLAENSQLELVNAAEEFIQQLKVAYTRVQLNRSNPLNKEVVRRVNARLLEKNTNWLMTYSDWERRIDTIRTSLGIEPSEKGAEEKGSS